jgi:flagellar M-ring protein FliF
VATASVFLRLSTTLDSGQIAGIVHLVSRAVTDLSPDNVTVVDQEGRALTAVQSDSGMAASDQMSRQAALQTELERSIGTLLGQVFGEKNVIVRVAANLDFNQHSTESVRFEIPQGGEEGLIRHLEDKTESSTGQGNTSGQPGTGTNGNGSYSPDNSGNSTSESRQRVIDYELDQIKDQIVYAPGAIKRLAVSVIINQSVLGDQTEQVKDAVQAAVGYDASRNDLISVQSFEFAEVPDPLSPAKPVAWYNSLAARMSLGAILALTLGLLVLGRGRRKQTALQQTQPVTTPSSANQALANVEALQEEELPMPQDTEAQRIRRHLQKMAKDKPEEFAVLIKAWLNEEG